VDEIIKTLTLHDQMQVLNNIQNSRMLDTKQGKRKDVTFGKPLN
jgi:hypothetical protein